jgi:hypothetical protein
MSVIADELHTPIVAVVVRHYLSYHISTCSTGVAGGVPVRMYATGVPRMAITVCRGRFVSREGRVEKAQSHESIHMMQLCQSQRHYWLNATNRLDQTLMISSGSVLRPASSR